MKLCLHIASMGKCIQNQDKKKTFHLFNFILFLKDPMKDVSIKGHRREKKEIPPIHDDHWEDQPETKTSCEMKGVR